MKQLALSVQCACSMGKYTDLLGVNFCVRGRSIETGFDCLGLAIEVLKRNGIYLPDPFYKDFSERKDVRENLLHSVSYEVIDKPEVNCIIEINERGLPLHVAVYIGDGKMIHCTEDLGVIIEPIERYKYRIRKLYKVHTNNI